MKAQLETIQYTRSQASFHFFRREEPGFPSYRHFHPELELTYIEQGNGIRYVGDSISSFEPGDLVLIGANLPHDFVSSAPKDGDRLSLAYVFQFPGAIVGKIMECRPLDRLFAEADYGIHFVNPDDALLEKIKLTSASPSIKNFINFVDILNDLNNQENRKPISSIAFRNSNTSKISQDKISTVTRHISEQYRQHISVADMAGLTHMTPQSFCRWFKQSTGCSFVTYLNATRVEKACQLLLQTNDKIANIGYKTGFETVSHFNRTFKKVKKITPKEYRRVLGAESLVRF